MLDLSNENEVKAFREKSDIDSGWINAGFMVLEPKVLDYVKDDTIMFEREPMEQLAKEGQIMCWKHNGFWQCMDTLRDKEKLEKLHEHKQSAVEGMERLMALIFIKVKKYLLRVTQALRALASAKFLQMQAHRLPATLLTHLQTRILFEIANIEGDIKSVIGDIRDFVC